MLNHLPELPVYDYLPFEPVAGHGALLTDADNREYLDFYGGHAVATIGHSHPKLATAIAEQAQRLLFYSNAVSHEPRQSYCTRLLDFAPDNMVAAFFCNSGAEANENALTLARRLTGRNRFVSVEGGFHGRTLLTLSLSGLPRYRDLAADNPLLESIRILPFDNTDAVEAIVDENCAAVIVEPVQGLAGARACSVDFLARLRERCDQVGAVLIFDEVQCGSGRTGAFTAAQRLGASPHVLTLAKGLAGGFPIGAVLCDERVAGAAQVGALGSTFGGGPLAVAAGAATLSILKEENLIANALDLGDHLAEHLRGIDGVTRVDGLGLLIGIGLNIPAKQARDALLRDHRIIAGLSADPQTLRIMPPLSINQKQADAFCDALAQTLS